jgi:hypothetical protein
MQNDEAIAAVSLQAFRFGVDFDLIPLHFQPTQATTLLFATAETSAPKLKKHSSNRPGQFSTSSSAADIEYISALTLRTQFDGFRIKLRSSKLAQTNQTSHNVVSRLDTVLHTAPIDLSISFPIRYNLFYLKLLLFWL